jgi:hypothetical protein
MTDPLKELDGLDVQDPFGLSYWYVICSRCGMRWYVPKDPTKRTHVAISLLCAHVEQHDSE